MNKSIFNNLLHDTLQNNPECEAAAYIDLCAATRLGVYFYSGMQEQSDSDNEQMMTLLTNTVAELFNGKHITALADHFKYQQNMPPTDEYFHEITISGVHHTYVCVRLNFNPDHVLAFVFNHHIGRGMMLTEVKQFAKEIQNIAEKIPLNKLISSEEQYTIDSNDASPSLPQPTLVFNTPPEHTTDTKTIKPNPSHDKNKKEEDIFAALDRWLKNN